MWAGKVRVTSCWEIHDFCWRCLKLPCQRHPQLENVSDPVKEGCRGCQQVFAPHYLSRTLWLWLWLSESVLKIFWKFVRIEFRIFIKRKNQMNTNTNSLTSLDILRIRIRISLFGLHNSNIRIFGWNSGNIRRGTLLNFKVWVNQFVKNFPSKRIKYTVA